MSSMFRFQSANINNFTGGRAMNLHEVESAAQVEDGPQLEAEVGAKTNLRIDLCYYASD